MVMMARTIAADLALLAMNCVNDWSILRTSIETAAVGEARVADAVDREPHYQQIQSVQGDGYVSHSAVICFRSVELKHIRWESNFREEMSRLNVEWRILN